MLRTNTCGELTKKEVNKEVVLAGWVNTRRDHGGLIFIDLRDRYGLTQVVFDPQDKKSFSIAEKLRREDVIQIKGKIIPRKQGMANPNLKTGEIEVEASTIKILNKAETPPLEVDDRVEANEDVRLKYRYLDLRRPIMQERLKLRHDTITAARDFFNKNEFLEITTPLLVKSTPEGARDYVVPSRVNLGKFYALPQSPQLYKQLLMISGCDKYYQTAICLRDEDLRADRQPEHMQWDLEMSFVDAEDVREFVEGLYKHIFKEVLNIKLEKFPVFSYKEAMNRFGTDKPDIRFGLEIIDVTNAVKKSDFGVFKNAKSIKCLNPEKEFGRKDLDKYIDVCTKVGAKGMAWMKVTDKGLEGSIVKFFSEDIQKELIKITKAKKGSVLMFIADEEKVVNTILGQLRLKLRDDLGLVKNNDFKFCWVKDFPLFAWNEEEDRWEPEHHMFSMPKPEFVNDFEKRPGEVIGDLWDITLNGTELGSGSIRVTNPEIQERIMNFIGIDKKQAEKKFGFLLEAYKYGAPVHGGMGLGIDRTVALMNGINDIREVIAFPKNKAAQCPMDDSPSDISEQQLKELNIKIEGIKSQKANIFERIKKLLDENNISYRVMEHEAVYTSEQAAKIRGTDIKQGCKALILKTEKGYFQFVVPGDKEIDLNKVKKILNVTKVELANAKDVKNVTDCNIGSVPPFGNLFNLEVYFDKEVMKNKEVAFNAGSHTKSIKMKLKDLVEITSAKESTFSK